MTTTAPLVDARLAVTRDAFRLRMTLQVAAGEVLALLGPNGAGKTSALLALAGLLPVDEAAVRIADVVVEDTARGVHVPAHRRRVGLVFQDLLLFPHLSVRDNVAFGLRAQGTDRHEAARRADASLAALGLLDRATARPAELSGGQAQRVALARLLVTEPALVLLDEPLAAVDAGARPELRAALRRQLAGGPRATVVVTHDALDAFVLADRVVVLEGGVVVQQGTPAELAERPRSAFVAELVGLNFYRGTARGTAVTLRGGARVTTAHPAEGEVLLTFAPAAVTVHRQRPEGSARNAWPLTVATLEPRAERVRVRLTGDLDVAADLTPLSVAALGLEPGAAVWAAVKATETSVYPA